MAARYDGLGPLQINDRPIYCPQVKAALCPGNWVLFDSNDECFHSEFCLDSSADKKSIGLIMGTEDDNNCLKVNLFIHHTQELQDQLCLRQFKNPRYQWIPQILRTPTCKWIDSCDITSIAWVFQQQDLDTNQHEGHQGMENLFLLHHNDQGQHTHIHTCHTFCSDYHRFSLVAVDCYQERVWCGLQVLRSEISRHLGRFSEKQGSYTRVSSQVVVGKEAWHFLLSKVGHAIGSPIGRNSMASKRVLEPGLHLKSHRWMFYSTLLRFETEDELRCLSTVLGELVTVEVRKRRPKYGVVESLHLNDVMNVVAGSEVREEPFRIRTAKQGIDFIHDGVNRVRIRLRYQRYQRSSVSLAGCPSTILVRAIERKSLLVGPREGESSDEDDDDEVAVVVALARQFDHQGRVFEVYGIDLEARKVTAIVVWPVNVTSIIEFEYDDVNRYIRSRIDECNESE